MLLCLVWGIYILYVIVFFFSSRRRHTRCALVTGVRRVLFRSVPGQKNEVTYGVCCNPDGEGGFEYIAGVEISRLDDLSEQFRWIEIQPGLYAVFEHKGSLKSLPQTIHFIWKEWLPQSGPTDADELELELFSTELKHETAAGSMEIWITLKLH